MPSRDEQFEFFCKQWGEPEKEEPKMAKIARLVIKKDKEKTDDAVS